MFRLSRTILLVIAFSSAILFFVPTAQAILILRDNPPAKSIVSGPLADSLTLAYKALSEGALDLAERTFDEAGNIDPKSAEPYIGLAEVAMHRQEWTLVEPLLEKAIAIEPENEIAFRAMGRYLFLQGNFAEAEVSFKQALKITPKEPRLHIDLGDTYLKGLNDPKKAESAYRRAISLQKDHVLAHLGLAASLAVQGDIQSAIDQYNLAAQNAKGNPLPLHLLGRLYASQRRFDESLIALNRALKVSKNYVPAMLERGDVHVAKGELSLALVDYQTVAKLEPTNAMTQFNMGTVYYTQKKWALAEDSYEKAVDLDPNFYNAYNNLAWMAVERHEQLDNGLRWIKRAIEISPDSANLYDTLGSVYIARGENQLAAQALQKATTRGTPRPSTLYRLGFAYAKIGNNVEATAALQQALAISEVFPEVDAAKKLLTELE
jgi:tetratricopeptide (TPR) repeat protein